TVTDATAGGFNFGTASANAASTAFSVGAFTAYTNSNLATGGANTDNDLYTSSTALTGAVLANAILIRGTGITISSAAAQTLTLGTAASPSGMIANSGGGNFISGAVTVAFGGTEGKIVDNAL